MKTIHKIIIGCYFILISLNCISQKDSIKSKHQAYFSINVGVPLYNNFEYRIDGKTEVVNTNTRLKPSYNFSFEHNIKHFTINLLYNYTINEFTGKPYFMQGSVIGYDIHYNAFHKDFEIYQKVKYNYLQLGLGLGYNHSFKKHNITATFNLLQNILTNLVLSSYYVQNSPYNDKDTSQIVLSKNFKATGIEKNLGFYANIKLMYTYGLSKHFHLSFSLSASYGLLNTHSTSAPPYYNNTSLGYNLYYQKMIFSNIGIRYKLF